MLSDGFAGTSRENSGRKRDHAVEFEGGFRGTSCELLEMNGTLLLGLGRWVQAGRGLTWQGSHPISIVATVAREDPDMLEQHYCAMLPSLLCQPLSTDNNKHIPPISPNRRQDRAARLQTMPDKNHMSEIRREINIRERQRPSL